ncbi:MAG TPA: RNA 2'-phosphotransferase [Micromonosporaceae bacterium]|nr:RNA 2'-phosphotransferase [Micromonosporaceae bacterium]
MNDADLVRISKRLSLHLRHAPERIGLTLDRGGWVAVADLLAALSRHGLRLTRAELDEVVTRNDKQRFAYDPTGTRIRASQGHSTPVELDLPPVPPPPVLFHGTVQGNLAAIERDGLRPMARHDVHLSATVDTAVAVGQRRGRPVVLRLDAAAMARDGYEFRVSANGVWLTASVPPEYLAREP